MVPGVAHFSQARLRNNKEEIMADKMTTIQVSVETKDRLVKLGVMDDTYDSVIQRLLKELSDIKTDAIIKRVVKK